MRTIMVVLFVLGLVGCGGGGGGGGDHYSITDSAILQYQGGETLTYSFTQTGAYQDGSGAVNVSGKETTAIYGKFTFPDQPKETLKRVTTLDYQGGSTSIIDYFFYDDDGNLVHYLTGNENYYVNQENKVSGAIVLPVALDEGDSWGNEQILYPYKDVFYYGSRTFTVIDRQTVSVPFGNVEAYRINYSGSFSVPSSILPQTLAVDGTLWVHPEIGIIKFSETAVENNYGYIYSNTFAGKLTAINW